MKLFFDILFMAFAVIAIPFIFWVIVWLIGMVGVLFMTVIGLIETAFRKGGNDGPQS